MRQFLAEGLLLSALAGAAGFVAGVWVTRLLIALAQSGRAPFNLDVHPDARMLAITMATSVGTAVFVGLVPAIRATGLQLTSVLTESRATSADVAGVRLNGGRALVVTQVAISMALLIAAGLFARTLRNLESQDVGFGRDNVWMFWMAPIEAGRQGASLATLFGAAQDRVSVIPGVVSASPSTDCVMSGFIGLRSVSVAGRTPAADEDVNAQWNLVGPRFFGTMGMRLVAGRDFNPLDTDTSARVAVVNETMAQDFFGDANPIGRTFGFGRDLAQSIEIVGVVADAKYYSARDAKVPMVFLPYRQDVTHIFRMCLAVRLTDSSPATIDRIRRELRAIDPGVPLRLVNTTDDQLSRSLADERLTAWLAGSFSLLALLLACMGLFGVMSYMVARRTREIGVRIALGESRGGILRRVLRESLTLVGVGLIPGAIAAVIGGRFVQTLLFGVTPADPATMVEAALALASVAVLAAVIPARRAASVDPTVALRAY
jgi:predicted permease